MSVLSFGRPRSKEDLARISVCGVICHTDCKAYEVECDGCNEVSGKVSWAAFYNLEHCPIYSCVQNKQLGSCADCGAAPCDTWLSTRGPSMSDEAFAADINNRLTNLKLLKG